MTESIAKCRHGAEYRHLDPDQAARLAAACTTLGGCSPDGAPGLGPCTEDCERPGIHFHGRASSDPCCGQHKDCGEWLDEDGEPDDGQADGEGEPGDAPNQVPGLNAYEVKQESRRERLLAAADRAEDASQAAYAQSRRIGDFIPPGQPILVGHHSEGRHRRDLQRMDGAMRRTIEEGKRAEELRRRADGVGRGGISSDDPEAVPKLRAELAELEALHERQKAANKAVRAKDPRAALAAQGVKPEHVEELLRPDYMGRIGFPAYVFSNRNANMRRIRLRIEELEKRATQAPTPERLVAGVRVVDNAEGNRLQLFFPGKPDEATRSQLKRHGFRWTPTLGCWQAFRSNRATWAAGVILGVDLLGTPQPTRADPPGVA